MSEGMNRVGVVDDDLRLKRRRLRYRRGGHDGKSERREGEREEGGRRRDVAGEEKSS